MSHREWKRDRRDHRKVGRGIGGIGESGDCRNKGEIGGKRRYYHRNDTDVRKYRIQIREHQKESITQDTSHREQGRKRRGQKGSGDESRIGARVSEQLEGAEIVGIRRKKG